MYYVQHLQWSVNTDVCSHECLLSCVFVDQLRMKAIEYSKGASPAMSHRHSSLHGVDQVPEEGGTSMVHIPGPGQKNLVQCLAQLMLYRQSV